MLRWGQKGLQCDQCIAFSKNINNLWNHIKRITENTKLYDAVNVAIMIRMKLAEGLREFVPPTSAPSISLYLHQCGNDDNEGNQLRTRKKMLHWDLSPLQCNQCIAYSKNINNL